jgi:type I restriction enzyme S subunit
MPAPNLQASRKTKKTAVGEIPVEWSVAPLGKCAQVERGKFAHRPRNEPRFFGGTMPFVQTSEVSNARGPIQSYAQTLSQEGVAISKVFPKGTLLMTIVGANIGSVAELGIEAACPDSLVAIKPGPGVDKDYLRHFLQTLKTRINYLAPANARQNVSVEFLNPLPIPLPPLDEQKHLAGLFSTWDSCVNRMGQLLEATAERKRGLMQHLLTGQTRFRGFKDKWRHCCLGDVVESINRPVEWKEDELYRLASVRRNSGGVFSREELYGYQIKVKKLQTICTGDFLISHIQAAYGAMTLVPDAYDGAKVSELYTILRPKTPKAFDIRILGYLGQSERMWYMAIQASNGFFAERLRLNFDPEEFLRLPVNIPPTFAEQKKIADTLEACDRESDLLEKQLAALKEQKRGLTQKLLTGEIRVKTKS